MEKQQRCDSILPAHNGLDACWCELPAGHELPNVKRPKGVRYSVKHRNGGVHWTQGGADLVAA